MKYLSILLLGLVGCSPSPQREPRPIKTKEFVIGEKKSIKEGIYNRFYFKNRDTIIMVNERDYLFFEIGDTLILNAEYKWYESEIENYKRNRK
jgi:hypothetical protein|nr:MAG TPA: TRAF PROTEIN, TRAO PROTEIN, TRAN ADHESION, BACTERIAL SECRETION.5A [Caudoviricetes sp.]